MYGNCLDRDSKNKCKNTLMRKLEILDAGFLTKLRSDYKYLCRLMVS